MHCNRPSVNGEEEATGERKGGEVRAHLRADPVSVFAVVMVVGVLLLAVVHVHDAPVDFEPRVVVVLHEALRVVHARKLDEGEAARLARHLVPYEPHVVHRTVGLQRVQDLHIMWRPHPTDEPSTKGQ